MVHCVVAFRAEGAPLIEHFGLVKSAVHRRYQVFEATGLRLILSGMGRDAASAATRYLGNFSAAHDPAQLAKISWLNLGIAGHGRRPIGDIVLATRVIDENDELHFRIPVPDFPSCPLGTICTVDKPEIEYRDDLAYEMEATGFVASARSFASAPQVQCLKIVSDGPASSHKRVSPSQASALIRNHITTIESLIVHIDSYRADQ